ncbi:phosphoribosyltransferase [Candidatus Dependentiae bacterium]
MMKFKDRVDAGQQLVATLEKYRGDKEAIVIGLPRGGVVTAFEVATALGLDLDIIVTRKIGAPMQPELAVGALSQDGGQKLDYDLMTRLGLSEADLEPIIAAEQKELARRLSLYRQNREPLSLEGSVAIIVDDGIATGATMLAAIDSARTMGAKKIVVAVPVCPPDSLRKIEKVADELVCLFTPELFFGIGGFYQEFGQTSDEQVIQLLQQSWS